MHCFQVHVKYLSRLTIAGPLQMMDTWHIHNTFQNIKTIQNVVNHYLTIHIKIGHEKILDPFLQMFRN
jgi:hypothetical protein